MIRGEYWIDGGSIQYADGDRDLWRGTSENTIAFDFRTFIFSEVSDPEEN